MLLIQVIDGMHYFKRIFVDFSTFFWLQNTHNYFSMFGNTIKSIQHNSPVNSHQVCRLNFLNNPTMDQDILILVTPTPN